MGPRVARLHHKILNILLEASITGFPWPFFTLCRWAPLGLLSAGLAPRHRTVFWIQWIWYLKLLYSWRYLYQIGHLVARISLSWWRRNLILITRLCWRVILYHCLIKLLRKNPIREVYVCLLLKVWILVSIIHCASWGYHVPIRRFVWFRILT